MIEAFRFLAAKVIQFFDTRNIFFEFFKNNVRKGLREALGEFVTRDT